jgi:hypothetical protein
MKIISPKLSTQHSPGHFDRGQFPGLLRRNDAPGFYLMLVAGVLILSGCRKQDPPNHCEACQCNNIKGQPYSKELAAYYKGLPQKTMCELQEARAASEKYRDIDKALQDGYADISVILPNMGFHYMKAALSDSIFEVSRPEILVYNKNHDGVFELVAVEYAVPIPLTPNVAPEGFTGSADVWERNTGFGLWLLHAWVWHFNPAGVFNPTNPEVHVHIP